MSLLNNLYIGCGGGYDIYGAIPLHLTNEHNSYFVSLSFTNVGNIKNSSYVNKINDYFYSINTAQHIEEFDNIYFPEYHFSREMKVKVYFIIVDLVNINKIRNCYKYLIEKYSINTAYLIDGGCDAFLKGDETELATPVEDMMSIKALYQFNNINKFVCGIGLSVDCNTVLRNELDDRLTYLRKNGILISEFQITDKRFEKYIDVVYKSQPEKTIVHSLICAKLEGHSGKYTPPNLKKRIGQNNVELDDLITLFVTCDYNKLYEDNLYVKNIDDNMDTDEIDLFITKFQNSLSLVS